MDEGQRSIKSQMRGHDANLEEQRWRRRLWFYRAGLGLFGLSIAIYFGPNVILFGKLTWISPADFVPIVLKKCVPAVVAIKEYQQDHNGQLPKIEEDLVPKYWPRNVYRGGIQGKEFAMWAMYNHRITYNLDGQDEHWEVRGAYTSGRIPLPPVVVGPAATQTTPEN